MPGPLSNFIMKSLINSPLHSLLGRGFAVITVVGRKSGREYSTPINVKQQGQDWAVISLQERTWWRNLRDGRLAKLRFAGHRFTVQGRIIETTEDVSAWLKDYFRQSPGIAKYFGIHLASDGQADPKEVEREAAKRVIVHLSPV